MQTVSLYAAAMHSHERKGGSRRETRSLKREGEDSAADLRAAWGVRAKRKGRFEEGNVVPLFGVRTTPRSGVVPLV